VLPPQGRLANEAGDTSAGPAGYNGNVMKIFSTRFHGLLDYATVVTLPVLFRALGAGDGTQRVADGGALATLVYSLCTDYERGAWKALPMPAHLALDALLGVTLCAAALRRTDEEPVVRGALAGLGLFSLFASVTTETGPS
jgi:hypothetical protein